MFRITEVTTSGGVVYSSLHVIVLKDHQFGKYICQANNDIGTTEATVHLTQL